MYICTYVMAWQREGMIRKLLPKCATFSEIYLGTIWDDVLSILELVVSAATIF